MLRVTGDEIHGFKAFTQDLEEVLLAISVPTMIFNNTGDDIYFAAKRASLRPDFKFKEFSDGTHDIVDFTNRQMGQTAQTFCRMINDAF